MRSSHGSPVFWHLGPSRLGDTSPRFVEANDATNGPWHIRLYWSYYWYKYVFCSLEQTFPVCWLMLTFLSTIWLATPLLSPDISWFVLFMETGCTENQLMMPIGSEVSSSKIVSCGNCLSVSPSYLSTQYLHWCDQYFSYSLPVSYLSRSSLGFAWYEVGLLLMLASSSWDVWKYSLAGFMLL